jgi:hypothetical protein
MKKRNRHLLAVLSFDCQATPDVIERRREEFERRLHAHLDPRCVVTMSGRKIHVELVGKCTEEELLHKARGIMRVYEWEAA